MKESQLNIMYIQKITENDRTHDARAVEPLRGFAARVCGSALFSVVF
jgi:hypothetical protein